MCKTANLCQWQVGRRREGRQICEEQPHLEIRCPRRNLPAYAVGNPPRYQQQPTFWINSTEGGNVGSKAVVPITDFQDLDFQAENDSIPNGAIGVRRYTTRTQQIHAGYSAVKARKL